MSDIATAVRGSLRERTAEEIRALLARRRISAAELARRAGLKQSTLARRMTGEIAFDLDELELIADVLQVPVHELLPAKGGDYLGGKAPVATRPVDNRPKNVTPKGVPRSGRDGSDLRRPRRLRPNPGMVSTQRAA